MSSNKHLLISESQKKIPSAVLYYVLLRLVSFLATQTLISRLLIKRLLILRLLIKGLLLVRGQIPDFFRYVFQNFYYDGQGPGAYFSSGSSDRLSNDGYQVPNEKGSMDVFSSVPLQNLHWAFFIWNLLSIIKQTIWSYV